MICVVAWLFPQQFKPDSMIALFIKPVTEWSFFAKWEGLEFEWQSIIFTNWQINQPNHNADGQMGHEDRGILTSYSYSASPLIIAVFQYATGSDYLFNIDLQLLIII